MELKRHLLRTGSPINWDDLRIFLGVATHGSVRAAAAHLSVSHSTVARRIEALERALDARLFDRGVTGYEITDTGKRLSEFAAAMGDQAVAIERFIAGEDRRLQGDVRVTMPLSTASHLLMQELADFATAYPDVDLEIVASDSVLNISKREADIALRFVPIGTSPPEHLVGRRLAVSCNAPYATPEYLKTHALSGDTPTARWLGWSEGVRFPRWVKESPLPTLPTRHQFNDPLAQRAAAERSMGIALIPCMLGDSSPTLVRVPGTEPCPKFDVWVLTHPDLKDTARLLAMRACIAEAVLRKQHLLLGKPEP